MSQLEYSKQFQDFKTTWNNLIEKIEKECIDGEGVAKILVWFSNDETLANMHESTDDSKHKAFVEGQLIESKLIVALMIAHSRFRLANRGALAKFFGGLYDKLPDKGFIPK